MRGCGRHRVWCWTIAVGLLLLARAAAGGQWVAGELMQQVAVTLQQLVLQALAVQGARPVVAVALL